MRVGGEYAERGPLVFATAVTVSLALVTAAVLTGRGVLPLVALIMLAMLVFVSHRSVTRWQSLLAAMILVILFVPIKRYAFPGNLPLDLEPYRLVVALIVAGWIASMLVDPRVRLRRSGLEGPIFLIAYSSLASVAVNQSLVDETGVHGEVVKGLAFLVSYFLIVYVVVSAVRSHDEIVNIERMLVGGGTLVAVGALVEFHTGFNVFDRIADAIPLLEASDAVDLTSRGGTSRVFASAQGPIPLGAMLVMLMPFALHLGRATRQRRWWVAGVLLVLGALATVSRTSTLMLAVVGLVFLILRPVETRRMWPALVPALVVVHAAVPGTIGSLEDAFFPPGGLVKEQSAHPGWGGSGRIADLGPAMDQFAERPLLGQGFSTRQTGREQRRDQILDDQWLKNLLETGVIGTFAWIWLFGRFIRRTGRAAKDDDSDRGWLLVAVTASVTAYAMGMVFFDAFSFVQVTLVLFVVIALGAASLSIGHRPGLPGAEIR